MRHWNLVVLVIIVLAGRALQAQTLRYAGQYDTSLNRSGPSSPASYWMERDLRYRPAVMNVQPASFAANAAYLPINSSATCCGCLPPPATPYVGPSYARVPTGPLGYGSGSVRPALPKGYYRGDGLFGKDAVYAENQPVRNIFRYLMP